MFYSISDINECEELLNGGCDKHADCTNTDGSRTCKCRSGFSGNGINCIGMSICEENNAGETFARTKIREI